MQRFYSPTLTTCFKSSTLLALLVAVPTLVHALWDSVLPTGIAAIMVVAYIYRNSLTRAGLNVTLVRLSSFSAAAETLLTVVAVGAHFALYIILANQLGFIEIGYDAARLILATTLVSFLPVTLFGLSKLFRN